MSEHIYKQVELTGSSKTSVEDAVQNAITKAGKTLHNIHWFQMVDTRGYIEGNSSRGGDAWLPCRSRRAHS